MNRTVLFYVQHLQGVGHVFRAARIANALVSAGFAVELVFGGVPIPGFDIKGARIHYLPPVRAGEAVFNKLENERGEPVDDDYRQRRRDMLLAIFHATRPDVILTEAFPFGRRQMRFELLPLMEAAHARQPRPVVIASVRDILQENAKPERDREVVDILNRFFDRIFVHGDPGFVRLEDSFPHADEIAAKVAYTGIVAPPRPAGAGGSDDGPVVVSVGGGAFGQKLLETALRAKPLSSQRGAPWTVLTGLRTTEEEKRKLDRLAEGDLAFHSFVDDLPALLAGARLSISRGGYNTAADIYAAGCRAIVVPLSDGIETEQIQRVGLMRAHRLAEAVGNDEETPEAIAAAIDRAMATAAPDRAWLDIAGADNTARLLGAMLDAATAAKRP